MVVESTIALITAVSTLLGTIGGLIIVFVKAKQNITSTKHEIDDKLIKVGESLDQTDDWILENQEKLTTVARVVTNLSPDAKKILEEQGVNIDKATIEINRIKDELSMLKGVVPGARQGNRLTN
ncbi:MAG: hypothetical protein ACPKPY_03230 [Nitrososphaeraceae archaeon]